MSRHRNLRTISYSDDYEDDDDMYGRSVEDDYNASPSTSQFIFDRSRNEASISSFLNNETTEQEKPTTHCSDHDLQFAIDPDLELNQAKLYSCYEEITRQMGTMLLSKDTVFEIIIENDFSVDKSLETILKNSTANIDQQSETLTSKAKEKLKSGNRSLLHTPVSTPRTLSPCSGRGSPSQFRSPAGSGSRSPCSGRGSPVSDSRKSADQENTLSKSKSKKEEEVVKHFQRDRCSGKENVHVIVIGHVDAGKSTIMGHLLCKLGLINSKIIQKYEHESKKAGKQSFLYAWILDETSEERKRGVTMDIGQSKFETKNKVITLLDAPGHKDFIPNMITGATQADAAVLVVDATRGEFETGIENGGQTREHALLVRSLGINQLAVAVNKMDNVSWSKERFDEICKKLISLLRPAGYKDSDITFIPCSGLNGENLTDKVQNVEWYNGPTLINVIDTFNAPIRPVTKPFRLYVSDLYKGTGSNFFVSGKIETGCINIGDKLLIQPQGEPATVKSLTIDQDAIQVGYAGDYVNVSFVNYDFDNMTVGCVLCDIEKPIPVTNKFEARIVVFNVNTPITIGYMVTLHLISFVDSVVLVELRAQMNKATGKIMRKKPRCLTKNTAAIVVVETSRPVCLELFSESKELGRIMLREAGETVAAGVVTEII